MEEGAKPEAVSQWIEGVILSALTAVAAVLGWAVKRWVGHVETHVSDSRLGYERIAALEAKVFLILEELERVTKRLEKLE